MSNATTSITVHYDLNVDDITRLAAPASICSEAHRVGTDHKVKNTNHTTYIQIDSLCLKVSHIDAILVLDRYHTTFYILCLVHYELLDFSGKHNYTNTSNT